MSRATVAALVLGAVVALTAPGARAQWAEPLGGLRMPTLYGRACEAIAYKAVPVYQSPGGLRVGQLVLDHPEYAKTTTTHCSFVPKVHLKPEGTNRLMGTLDLEVSYEEPALAVFEVRSGQAGTWYRGVADTVPFWVKDTDVAGASGTPHWLSYERDLVMGVALLSETCDAQGRCRPAASDLQKTADEAGSQRRDSCYFNAYDLVTVPSAYVTLPGGRRAYKLKLAESLAVAYGKTLPAELLVPTRDYRGRWTGFFFSRGC